MYNVAIVDDELIWLKELVEKLKKAFKELKISYYNLSMFQNFDDFERSLKQNKYHLVFMDVCLNKGVNSIEQIKKLKNLNLNFNVCFVSTHKEYVFDALDIFPVTYLLKPIDDEKVKSIITKDYNINGSVANISLYDCNEKHNRLFLLKDIKYIEHYYRKTSVFTSKGVFVVRENLEDILAIINDYPIVRIHKSFVCNLHYVKKLSRYYFTLEDEEKVPISKRDYSRIKKIYEDYLLKLVLK